MPELPHGCQSKRRQNSERQHAPAEKQIRKSERRAAYSGQRRCYALIQPQHSLVPYGLPGSGTRRVSPGSCNANVEDESGGGYLRQSSGPARRINFQSQAKILSG
eukprot:3554438-Rhodomonas_salina.3